MFVTAAEAEALQREQGAVILDARTDVDQFIPGAAHAPWALFTTSDGNLLPARGGTAGTLEKKLSTLGVLGGGKTVIVYGGWHKITHRIAYDTETFGEEGRLFWMLHYLDHQSVRCLCE